MKKLSLSLVFVFAFASAIIAQDGLPTNAEPGKCYAKCYIADQWKTETETVMSKAASKRVENIPAKYKTVTETVLSKEAGQKVNVVPARYETRTEQVLVKALQRHPSTGAVMHMDLQRAQADKVITTRVPLSFINAAQSEGVSKQGGRLTVESKLAEVRCLPANLPAVLTVDVIKGQLDQIFHLSDVILPEGVELVSLLKGEDHDQPIARIGKSKR